MQQQKAADFFLLLLGHRHGTATVFNEQTRAFSIPVFIGSLLGKWVIRETLRAGRNIGRNQQGATVTRGIRVSSRKGGGHFGAITALLFSRKISCIFFVQVQGLGKRGRRKLLGNTQGRPQGRRQVLLCSLHVLFGGTGKGRALMFYLVFASCIPWFFPPWCHLATLKP